VVVLLIAGIAGVAYSAAQIRPSVSSPTAADATLDANGTVEDNASLQIANPGFFSFSHIEIALSVLLPSGGLLARSSSPTVAISGGSVGDVPLTLRVPFSVLQSNPALLTNDTSLRSMAWFNATYADVFPVAAYEPGNLTWGAPVENLTTHVGAESVLANGTIELPVAISFSNHASFEDVGTLVFLVSGSSALPCSSGSIPMAVPPHGAFGQTEEFLVPSSCLAGGGTFSTAFVAYGHTIPLTSEAIP
jgi:hypothetical protein